MKNRDKNAFFRETFLSASKISSPFSNTKMWFRPEEARKISQCKY
jgi:hypothetical protein